MMGAPVPPLPPPHLGGPSGSYGNWKSEKAKRAYIHRLEARVAAAPPTWLIVGGFLALGVVLAVKLWSLR